MFCNHHLDSTYIRPCRVPVENQLKGTNCNSSAMWWGKSEEREREQKTIKTMKFSCSWKSCSGSLDTGRVRNWVKKELFGLRKWAQMKKFSPFIYRSTCHEFSWVHLKLIYFERDLKPDIRVTFCNCIYNCFVESSFVCIWNLLWNLIKRVWFYERDSLPVQPNTNHSLVASELGKLNLYMFWLGIEIQSSHPTFWHLWCKRKSQRGKSFLVINWAMKMVRKHEKLFINYAGEMVSFHYYYLKCSI